ncbi:hypothetical protein, partial [Klebsiella pneumoniae]|uniref:hypothetical protein n=1 Tax=Klebsiella pneumoniae TaxID=573 RepID=UPI0021617B9E
GHPPMIAGRIAKTDERQVRPRRAVAQDTPASSSSNRSHDTQQKQTEKHQINSLEFQKTSNQLIHHQLQQQSEIKLLQEHHNLKTT